MGQQKKDLICEKKKDGGSGGEGAFRKNLRNKDYEMTAFRIMSGLGTRVSVLYGGFKDLIALQQ